MVSKNRPNLLNFAFTFNVVSAASAIRDASSSALKVKKFTPAKPKVDVKKPEMSTAKENEKDEETVSKPRDRNRDSLMYDDDDLNTSKPKLEKLIEKDKERIRLQQEGAKPKKKTAVSQASGSNSNRAEKKMEVSVQKFKTFLDDNIESTPKQIDQKTNGDVNKTLPTAGTSKASMPSIIDSKTKTPVQNNKRLSSAHSSLGESSAKKRRSSISNTKPINYKPFGKLLEGVVIVISGIQVTNNWHFPYAKSKIFKWIFFRIPNELTSGIKRRKWVDDTSQIGMAAAHI